MKMAISVIYTFWRCFFQTFQAVVIFLRRKMSRLKSKPESASTVSIQPSLYMDIKSAFDASEILLIAEPCVTVYDQSAFGLLIFR